MCTTDRKPKLFPVIMNPSQREMLSLLALTSGLSRGEVIRRLIIRETATHQLAHYAPPGRHTDGGRAMTTMPFGAHKGKRLEELPNDYLLWLGCLDDLRQPLLGAVLREMGRRIVELDRQAVTR